MDENTPLPADNFLPLSEVIPAGEELLRAVQKDYPLSPHWGKMVMVTPYQALFLSYGVDPSSKNPFFSNHYQMEHFTEHMDVEHKWPLIQNAILSGDLSLYDRSHIRLADFVVWLKKNALSMPDLLRELHPDAKIHPQEVTKPDILDCDPRILSLNDLARLTTRCIATALKKQNKDIGQKEMLLNDAMKSAIKLLVSLKPDKKPWQEQTYKDWIKDLDDDRESKRGPKANPK